MAQDPADGVYFGLMSGTSMDGVDGVAVSSPKESRPLCSAEAFVGFARACARRCSRFNSLATTKLNVKRGLQCARHPLRGVLSRIAVQRPHLRREGTRDRRAWPDGAASAGKRLHAADQQPRAARGNDAYRRGRRLSPPRRRRRPPRRATRTGLSREVFAAKDETRVVCNLGGISNITILQGTAARTRLRLRPGQRAARRMGAAAARQAFRRKRSLRGQRSDGSVAAKRAIRRAFFQQQPPKSTGRDLFHAQWLDAKLGALRRARAS